MTSKRLFADLCAENRKRRLWPIALCIAGNFFGQLVYAYLAIMKYEERLADGRTVIEDVRLACFEMAGGLSWQIGILVVCLAIINAVQGYGYLFDSKMCDLYGAIPVKREKIFGSVCLNGIGIFAIPYIVFNILVIIYGLAKGFLLASFLPQLLGLMFSIISIYTLIYLVCTLACVMTGHIVVAFMAIFVFLAGGPATVFIIETYKQAFFMTYYWNQEPAYARYSSPIAVYMALFSEVDRTNYMLFNKALFIKTIVVIALCLVVYLICRALMKIRPLEAVGKSMAFEKTKPVIKCAITVVVSLYAGMFFKSIGGKFGMLIFGIICGLILSHAVIETIYEFDFKACLSNFGSLIVSAAITCLIVILYIFDPLGYETWIPRADKVKTYAIDQSYVYNGLQYSDKSGNSVMSENYIFENMKLTNMEKIEPLLIAGVENAKKYHNSFIFNREAYDNAWNDGELYGSFDIMWEMKDGRKIYRSFVVDLSDPVNKTCVKALFDDSDYKQSLFQIMDISEDDFDTVKYYDINGSHEVKIAREDRTRLLEAVKSDIENQPFEELEDSDPTMVIGLSKSSYYYGLEICNFYLYPSFIGARKVLEEISIPTDWIVDIDAINTLGIQCYDENDDVYDRWDTTDKEEIKAVLENSTSTWINSNSIWRHAGNDSVYVDLFINGNQSDYLVINDISAMPKGLQEIIEKTKAYE
ncbi:DUF6449 domain-containing protein [Butyrivibrio sp. AE3006]|uniref:DUF6449 domain-containing protein n=1 Tax=Butyrivibrio sp. AE3006 TaxID=1280673 RepID=UPI0003F7D25F|nr:DUF6449 domain-containing protein [Butyrivibrio sp. AE3006]